MVAGSRAKRRRRHILDNNGNWDGVDSGRDRSANAGANPKIFRKSKSANFPVSFPAIQPFPLGLWHQHSLYVSPAAIPHLPSALHSILLDLCQRVLRLLLLDQLCGAHQSVPINGGSGQMRWQADCVRGGGLDSSGELRMRGGRGGTKKSCRWEKGEMRGIAGGGRDAPKFANACMASDCGMPVAPTWLPKAAPLLSGWCWKNGCCWNTAEAAESQDGGCPPLTRLAFRSSCCRRLLPAAGCCESAFLSIFALA